MVNLFTELLRAFLRRRQFAPSLRVRLGPPDRDFVSSLPRGLTVNVYLADVRENRKLRSNERLLQRPTPDRVLSDPLARETLAASWVDAHYLISAWDTSTNQSIRALKEQEVIAKISGALLEGDPFNPQLIYDRQNPADEIEINRWPADSRNQGLPYQVMPPDGFPKLSEFWTTMGTGSPWKPVVYLVGSVPVPVAPSFEYPLVTTMRSSVGQTKNAPGRQLIPGTERDWFQIGGRVSRLDTPLERLLTPLEGVRVRLEQLPEPSAKPPTGLIVLQETRTNKEGRYQFLFAGPTPERPRRLQIVAEATGLQAIPLPVQLSPADPFPHDLMMVRL